MIITIPESKLLARLAGVGDGCWALALPAGVPVVVVLAVAVVEKPAVLLLPTSLDGLGEVNDSGPAVDCCAETVISCDQVKVKVTTVNRPILQRMITTVILRA